MLFYKVIQKANPRKLKEPNKYFAASVNSGESDDRKLKEDIAKGSTINTPDTAAVLEGLLELIPDYLKDGKIIKPGDFDSFTILLDSEAQDKASDVNIHTIKKSTIRFIPSKLLKESLNNIEYKRYKSKK